MKSTSEQLKKRGYLTDEEFEQNYAHASFDFEHRLKDVDASIRTAAVRRIRKENKTKYIPVLCEMLCDEKKLYTKIEISECLACFGDTAIEALLPLIGKIGNNQHKKIGNYDLNKNSYPLPRDIVARTLIRMGPRVFDYLKAQLTEVTDTAVLAEIIEIIGHITWNEKDLRFEEHLIHMYGERPPEIIRWKLIRAFQSFDSEEVETLLWTELNDEANRDEIKKEAQRSLSRIAARKEKRNRKKPII